METVNTIEIKRVIDVTNEDIDDIVCGMFEGGTTYWCDCAKVVGKYLGEFASEQISKGGELFLHDCEEDEWHSLTKEKVLNGLKLCIERGYDRYGAVQQDGTLDCGEIDGEIADIICQFALFGDIIYG